KARRRLAVRSKLSSSICNSERIAASRSGLRSMATSVETMICWLTAVFFTGSEATWPSRADPLCQVQHAYGTHHHGQIDTQRAPPVTAAQVIPVQGERAKQGDSAPARPAEQPYTEQDSTAHEPWPQVRL